MVKKFTYLRDFMFRNYLEILVLFSRLMINIVNIDGTNKHSNRCVDAATMTSQE